MQQVSPPTNYDLPQSYHIIKSALKEDIGSGDITTGASVPKNSRSHALIVAKSQGVLAGIHFCAQVFSILNSRLSFCFPVEEGSPVKKNQTVFEVSGSTHAILKGERTALNILGRMSGIATVTAQMVDKVEGTNAKILDTRKTMPGLRMLDKYAVRIGGGFNHRFGLDDMFLIKENHITAAGGIAEAVRKCKAFRVRHAGGSSKKLIITVEVTSFQEAETAIKSGADRMLLDNMAPGEIKTIVKKLKGKAEIEASGGISLRNVRQYAETGVDYISAGMLTHSVKAVDFSLLLQ